MASQQSGREVLWRQGRYKSPRVVSQKNNVFIPHLSGAASIWPWFALHVTENLLTAFLAWTLIGNVVACESEVRVRQRQQASQCWRPTHARARIPAVLNVYIGFDQTGRHRLDIMTNIFKHNTQATLSRFTGCGKVHKNIENLGLSEVVITSPSH